MKAFVSSHQYAQHFFKLVPYGLRVNGVHPRGTYN